MRSKEFSSMRWWSNIQALRQEKGMSESSLSLKLGKADNYICMASKNCSVPNVADALTVAQFFGTTVEDLAFGCIGLEIRRKRLEEELKSVMEEIIKMEEENEHIN